ncbi:parathyroid hormone-like [Antennarius striatus]|uniref:parathyroid hormone-like n=1 Tax=Antennarius striatus TaxID=241820 RepID=UPI0035AF0FEE
MQILDNRIAFMAICILQLFSLSEARPLRKRTVSEVQLMHSLGEHKQVQDRRDWLQMRLHTVHTAPARDGSGDVGPPRRRIRPEELPDLSDLTPDEIQSALNLLEKLLKSKQS